MKTKGVAVSVTAHSARLTEKVGRLSSAPDTYVVVKLKEEEEMTDVVAKTLTPKWDAKFSFGGVEEHKISKVYFEVWQNTGASSKRGLAKGGDQILGKASYRLDKGECERENLEILGDKKADKGLLEVTVTVMAIKVRCRVAAVAPSV